MFCFTSCTSATPTVATPSGWQLIYNVTGTNGRLALFALKVTGSEAVPTVTWSGLTTGTSGTPCTARIINFGTGFLESAGALVVDVLGAVASQAADATINAGGLSLTTVGADTFFFAYGLRNDDALTAVVDAGGEPVAWILAVADQLTSGADACVLMSYNYGPSTAGAIVNDHTWTITSGTSIASTGVMVAMALTAPVDDVAQILYTRNG